jgi:broad specificity phosphatase PhoE
MQTSESVYGRLDNFWKGEILPLRKTDAIVLVVTHGGTIGSLRKHLLGKNYTIHDSLRCKAGEQQKWEVSNCSITEIMLDGEGPGEFLTIAYIDHIVNPERNSDTEERLENSTGE